MDSSIAALLTGRFSELEDPRRGRAKRHELIDVVVIAISAVISVWCGLVGGRGDVRQVQERLA